MRVKVEMNSKGEVKAHRIEIPIQGGGGELPKEYRADAVSKSTDVGAVIPITISWVRRTQNIQQRWIMAAMAIL